MKKMVYEKPSMRVHKYQHQTRILAGSPYDYDDNGMSKKLGGEDEEVEYGW